jgi:hypothetical protein
VVYSRLERFLFWKIGQEQRFVRFGWVVSSRLERFLFWKIGQEQWLGRLDWRRLVYQWMERFLWKIG